MRRRVAAASPPRQSTIARGDGARPETTLKTTKSHVDVEVRYAETDQMGVVHHAAYLPYLATIFFFVFFGNIFEIIPGFAMPANARMANPAFMGLLTLVFFVSVGSITLMTFALSGLAIGFGTMFPQFETENAAQIPTSFGGLLYMMASIVVIAGVVILEARPVYGYLSAKAFGQPISPLEMALGFGAAALLCVLATIAPIAIAQRRLERVER